MPKAPSRVPCTVQGCAKSFGRNTDMKKHIKNVHNKIKDYKCEYDGCGKAYEDKTKLQTHINAEHTHQKPYKCPNPGCKFQSEGFTGSSGVDHHKPVCRYRQVNTAPASSTAPPSTLPQTVQPHTNDSVNFQLHEPTRAYNQTYETQQNGAFSGAVSSTTLDQAIEPQQDSASSSSLSYSTSNNAIEAQQNGVSVEAASIGSLHTFQNLQVDFYAAMPVCLQKFEQENPGRYPVDHYIQDDEGHQWVFDTEAMVWKCHETGIVFRYGDRETWSWAKDLLPDGMQMFDSLGGTFWNEN
ncbi:uncharacterized protein BDZ99DRAFT_474645 [Mytilinidion resinicola]|uniref:C2H2-type domain-containing protein n=1 Tax=Mytilinidion resinicola TaxID=574789 RepID=A0A6A6YWV6_9PEZI|nr:uncharacterized protein BDZ99DRAFT_474645 [Mytilinidion resinicola]KAF2812484.1 hypothetical protein BDZ99DRAFT_474645 [Mytilinidion resinicola]